MSLSAEDSLQIIFGQRSCVRRFDRIAGTRFNARPTLTTVYRSARNLRRFDGHTLRRQTAALVFPSADLPPLHARLAGIAAVQPSFDRPRRRGRDHRQSSSLYQAFHQEPRSGAISWRLATVTNDCLLARGSASIWTLRPWTSPSADRDLACLSQSGHLRPPSARASALRRLPERCRRGRLSSSVAPLAWGPRYFQFDSARGYRACRKPSVQKPLLWRRTREMRFS